jgi:glycosyltransferase involved in cell wall biosynthesis
MSIENGSSHEQAEGQLGSRQCGAGITISVVIPAYNAAHFLPRSLASVFAQTVAPHEVIVVDDGSTDNTGEVAASFGARVIRQENLGLAAARNTGIQHASGEWIALLDADDSWEPEKLARQVAASLPISTQAQFSTTCGKTSSVKSSFSLPIPDTDSAAADVSAPHNKLLIIIAYHFPPENTIGALRPYRFYRYLHEFGYQCVVITASPQPEGGNPSVVYCPDRYRDPARPGSRAIFSKALRKFVFSKYKGLLWGRSVSMAVRKIARENRGAQISVFSTFPPIGSHLGGWLAARAVGAGWIADFRDPLAVFDAHRQQSFLEKLLNKYAERFIFKRADIVIANTDAMTRIWKEKYPRDRDKIRLMWNGFDPADELRALPLPKRNYRLYSHTGELYYGRVIDGILESIARLMDLGKLNPSDIRLRFLGPIAQDCLPNEDLIRRARQEGWLEIIPSLVPMNDARALMQTSDGLILVQPQSSSAVPGKLFEYIQIGRPVLAYVSENSPSERILSQAGISYRCVCTNSTQQEFDRNMEEYFSLSSEPQAPTALYAKTFDGRKQSGVLAGLINELNMHGRPGPDRSKSKASEEDSIEYLDRR